MRMTIKNYEHEPEELVLSTLLRSVESRTKYLTKVQETDFSEGGYREIFRVMVGLVQTQAPITPETLEDALVGEPAVIKMLATFLFSTDIPLAEEDMFKRFKEDGVRVRLNMLQKYLADGFRKQKPTIQMLTATHGMLDRVEGGVLLDVSEPTEIIESTNAEIDEWVRGDVKVRTGVPEIDQRLFLNRLTGYNIVAGTPSAGKTTLVIQWFRYNAEQGIPCALFSLEMSKEQVYRKMALADPRIMGRELNAESLQDKQFIKKYKECINDLKRLPFFVIDNVLNIDHIYHLSRKLSASRKVRLIGLDYVQLTESSNPRDTEVTVVSNASKMLKKLSKRDSAKNYPACVTVALSQYSREEQKRSDGGVQGRDEPRVIVPRNSGLKGSSQLEQDADAIFHLINLSADPTTEEIEGEDWRPPDVSKIKFYCGKQREGIRGWIVNANYDKPKQQIVTRGMVERRGNPVAISRPMEF